MQEGGQVDLRGFEEEPTGDQRNVTLVNELQIFKNIGCEVEYFQQRTWQTLGLHASPFHSKPIVPIIINQN